MTEVKDKFMELILIAVIFILTCYVVYKNKKGTKLNVYTYVLEQMHSGMNRETIVINLIRFYKLSMRDAHQVIDDVELSGLDDKLKLKGY